MSSEKKKSIDFWLDQENVGMKTCRIGSASSMRGKKKNSRALLRLAGDNRIWKTTAINN